MRRKLFLYLGFFAVVPDNSGIKSIRQAQKVRNPAKAEGVRENPGVISPLAEFSYGRG